jgi:hypothetical protein
MGEPQVVIGLVAHPGREGVLFLVQLAAAGGVHDDPGISRLAEPPALLVQDLRAGGVVADVAGGVRRFLQGQQGVDGRPNAVPCHPVLAARRYLWVQLMAARDSIAATTTHITMMRTARRPRGTRIPGSVWLLGVVIGVTPPAGVRGSRSPGVGR